MRDALTGWLAALALLLMAACASAPPVPGERDVFRGEPPAYDYPLADPLAATVIGTPSAYRPDLPEETPVEELELTVFEGREIPGVFWYTKRLRYAVAAQPVEAPLVFMIAATGAGHRAAGMDALRDAFYAAGFHVISLPSPTHPNFLVTASTTAVPARPEVDARDLYRVMRLAYERVRDRIDVSAFHLAGYSLGGWHAAFVAELDERERAFGFDRVVVINPPLSLHSTIRTLDGMLAENLPDDPAGINAFIERFFAAFAEIYGRRQELSFDSDFLYRIYEQREPEDESLAALIGLSFRLLSTNMIFVSDVMSNAGYIVPRHKELTPATSLTDYFKVGSRISFAEYFDDVYVPYYIARQPGLTRDDLIAQASLESIADYLADNPKIGLIHNADDIILAPGELDTLRAIFGDRARVFPTGGHIGNLMHRAVLDAAVDFLRDGG